MGKKLASSKPTTADAQELATRVLDRGRVDRMELSGLSWSEWLWVAHQGAERCDLELLKSLESVVDHKPFTKALRSIFHKLRSQGVDIRAHRNALVSLEPTQHSIEYIGAINAASLAGEFCVCVQRRVEGKADSPLVIFEVGPDALRFDVFELKRAEIRTFIRSLLQPDQSELPWIECEGSYLEHMFAYLVGKARERGLGLSSLGLDLAVTLEKTVSIDEHPIEQALISKGIPLATSLGTSGDVFDDPMYQVPFHDRYVEILSELGLEDTLIAMNDLILSPQQRMERIQSLTERALETMIERAGPSHVALGLRHNAWFAMESGDGDSAAIFARVARVLEDGQVPVRQIPFFTRAVSHFIPMIEEVFQLRQNPPDGEQELEAPPESASSPLLWTPSWRDPSAS